MTHATIGDPAQRERIALLLHRYPALTPGEADDVLAFLRHGAILDIGMLKGDAALAATIADVQRDHAPHFRITLRQRLAVAALLIVPVVAMCWFAWYWGTK